MSDVIRTSTAPKPVGAYPHARRVGDLLFLSGIGPRDAATDAIPDGIEAQVNVENIVGADYFPTAHNDTNSAPGAPTTAKASVRFVF